METNLATLGGGCFWCIEAVFLDLKGVEKVESGYSGGSLPNPKYEDVCEGNAGHAEVVQITFTPSIISFEELLEIFFTLHDPTTMDRQGADIGPQYRSIIFYHDVLQREIAEKTIMNVNFAKIWDRPIVTQLEPFKSFYLAEDYHQNYFKLNSEQPYCRAIIAPKVAKLRSQFGGKLRIIER